MVLYVEHINCEQTNTRQVIKINKIVEYCVVVSRIMCFGIFFVNLLVLRIFENWFELSIFTQNQNIKIIYFIASNCAALK